MSSSSRKVSLIKNARGDMRFEGCQPDGGKVTIKNGGSKVEYFCLPNVHIYVGFPIILGSNNTADEKCPLYAKYRNILS
jgi:hypothetical protein